MKRISLGAALVAWFALAPVARSQILPVSDDLWDIQAGTIVVAGSPTEFYSRNENMLGGDSADLFPSSEHLNTIFLDFQPPGTVFTTEWKTAAPVTVRSFVLNTANDQPPNSPQDRAISHFVLQALVGGSYQTVFELFPVVPYADTVAPPHSRIELDPSGHWMSVAANIAAVTSDQFRAEFVQLSPTLAPRVLELDGFATSLVVPEPGGVALAIAGAFTLTCAAWLRCRNQQGAEAPRSR